jgi:hypothetical protein
LEIEYFSILISVSNQAFLLRDLGKFEETEKINRRVLEEYEKILEIKYFSIFNNINNLAFILRDQGKYKRAEKMN